LQQLQFFYLKDKVIKQKDELFKHSFCRIDIEPDDFYKKLYENIENAIFISQIKGTAESEKNNNIFNGRIADINVLRKAERVIKN
jgi:hypothetical protein